MLPELTAVENDALPLLLAARSVLDAPKAAWRQVSGVAMTSFVAVFAGLGIAFSDAMAASDLTAQDRLLLEDLRAGILLTLVISFVTVAASVAVNQSADILDRRELYGNLDRMGMSRSRIDRAPSLRPGAATAAPVARGPPAIRGRPR